MFSCIPSHPKPDQTPPSPTHLTESCSVPFTAPMDPCTLQDSPYHSPVPLSLHHSPHTHSTLPCCSNYSNLTAVLHNLCPLSPIILCVSKPHYTLFQLTDPTTLLSPKPHLLLTVLNPILLQPQPQPLLTPHHCSPWTLLPPKAPWCPIAPPWCYCPLVPHPAPHCFSIPFPAKTLPNSSSHPSWLLTMSQVEAGL